MPCILSYLFRRVVELMSKLPRRRRIVDHDPHLGTVHLPKRLKLCVKSKLWILNTNRILLWISKCLGNWFQIELLDIWLGPEGLFGVLTGFLCTQRTLCWYLPRLYDANWISVFVSHPTDYSLRVPLVPVLSIQPGGPESRQWLD